MSILIAHGGQSKATARALGLCVQTRGSTLARQLRLDPGADLS